MSTPLFGAMKIYGCEFCGSGQGAESAFSWQKLRFSSFPQFLAQLTTFKENSPRTIIGA